MQCKDCKINIHQKCVKSIIKNCKAPLTDEEHHYPDEDSMHFDGQYSPHAVTDDLKRMSIDDPQFVPPHDQSTDTSNTDESNDQNNNQSMSDNSSINSNNEYQKDQNTALSSVRQGKFRQEPRSNRKRNQIALQRISQRIKKTNGFFWSGYMVYYTNLNLEVIFNLAF